MQYPIVREYKPDITMSLKENEIDDELKKIPKRDFIYAIVPKYAPLFLDSLVLKLPNGQELVNGEHYQIPGVMGNLTRLCGRSVISIIEIIDTSIEEVLISYHTMGHFNVLDESMYSLMESAINDSRPIEWDNVTDKPIVFAPEMHHHSLIYDFHSFQGMIDMIDNIMRVVEFGRVDPVVIRAKHFFETMNKYIDIYDRQIRDSLERHIGAYDSHGITKEQVNLGHLDNIATATDAEARALKDNLRMTVRQLGLIIKQFTYKKEEYLPDGLIPFSQYSGPSFLPKYVLGNYAGVNTSLSNNLFIHEDDGSVTGLCTGNTQDGLGDGLYYVRADKDFNNLIYTGHLYNHTFFKERNITLYELVYLDNEFIIVRGDDFSTPFSKERIFISRTNGTLNPAKHIYSEIIEEELTTSGSVCATQIGDEIVLSAGHNLLRVLFSFKATELGTGVIKPDEYEITYTTLGSNIVSTSDFFRPIEEEFYSNGALKSFGFSFAEETNMAIPTPRGSYVLRSFKHSDPNKCFIYLSMKYQFSKRDRTGEKLTPIIIFYEMDIPTKTLTVIKKPTEYYFNNNDYDSLFITRYLSSGTMVDIDEKGKFYIKDHADTFGSVNTNIEIFTPPDRGDGSYYDTLEELLDAINIFYQPSDLVNITNPIKSIVPRRVNESIKIDTSGFKIVFSTRETVVFKGKVYDLNPQTLLLSDYYNPPTNKVYYLYVRLTNGEASYHIENTIVDERYDSLYVGVIKTDSTKIYLIELSNVTMVEDHRLSTIKMGNAIPVTLGSIKEEGLIQIIKDPTDYV